MFRLSEVEKEEIAELFLINNKSVALFTTYAKHLMMCVKRLWMGNATELKFESLVCSFIG